MPAVPIGFYVTASVADDQKERWYRDVFIQIVPVQAYAATAYGVLKPLGWRRLEETREICKKNSKLASIC
ncbi:MAG: hypothetical protein A2283_14860 [Lentisphaerae bacterium RIFOXYA12_FULL_48_11]|nr:MAG: hypothetical protein A2283_14860 [Lentisphaerae bacterium RIFOXYA12_FULL_48_11]